MGMSVAYMEERFYSLGYNKKFSLLGRVGSGRRADKYIAKCLTCGAEFEAWKDTLNGRQKRLICKKCGAASDGNNVKARSPKVDEAMAFYTEGHSVSETAKKFGFSKTDINNFVKDRKITNGRDWKEAGLEASKAKSKEASVRREAERKKRKEDRERLLEKKKRQRELEQKRMQEEKAIKREQEKERAEAEKADALFHLLNDRVHICSVCGKYFSVSEFMESKGRELIPTSPKYCSKECENKRKNRKSKEYKRRRGVRDSHRHRAKKYGCEYDSSITLKKLIERDGLRCAICGKMCDWNDHSWSEYSGPLYPSIDHIVPMSKGGGHTWDNVQVAHIICNSYKSDKDKESDFNEAK